MRTIFEMKRIPDNKTDKLERLEGFYLDVLAENQFNPTEFDKAVLAAIDELKRRHITHQ
jgi:hypothetical protein